MTDTDPTFYQRFYHAARIAGPPPDLDPEKAGRTNTRTTTSKEDQDEKDTWLAREKRKSRRSYLLCVAVLSIILVVGIGVAALVVSLGHWGK
ncbi:unnamed protein product [Tuber aestivum]|uniref:Uncharacterized protein n=1 Tax=Tuber aestivum TaxID=59557 RepID=A0A292Q6Q3_9PEZI|nr:unnamed protein product [Tuber aestivum]